ncbi:hypothetical protein DFJ73DRAFT_781323 [Zopfochytrium polystomum]|nr:hypothetical protein DFJ73DRAFT_781323 [Zopfochytrium polystomum]
MPRKSFAGKLWVDLGTGCGIVGLAAAHSGVPNVYLTDTPSVIQQGYIARNVYNNPIEEGSSSVSVLELDWFKIDALSEDSGLPLFGQTVDTVTGADITYSRDAIAPLVSDGVLRIR